MKVRIGNDIKLNLTLKGNRNYNRANIKQLRCYFINTSLCDMCFPFGLGSCPNKCCHRYHECPCNTCNCCKWHHKYPLTPCNPAHGRGPLPPKHGDCCNCCGDKYNRFGGCTKCFHGHCCGNWSECCGCCDFDAKFYPYFRPGHNDVIQPMFDSEFKFLAPSRVLEGQNRIETYFPACEQFACGDYKLVVVVVMYESGWGKCDLHTYTIDYGYVVTLVDDESAPQGDLVINVDTGEIEGNKISDINMASTDYVMNQNTSMSLSQKDINGATYALNIYYESGWSTVYDPNTWDGETVTFTSSNPDVLTVDPTTGQLVAKTVNQDTVVTITVTIGNKTTSFRVTVKAAGADYIGFVTTTDPNEAITYVNDTNYFKPYDYSKTNNIENKTYGAYMWFICRMPQITPVIDGFNIPLNGPYNVGNNMYAFYSPKPQIATNWNVKFN